MRLIRAYILMALCFMSLGSIAQTDSSKLSYEQFIQMVTAYHPMAVQAELEGAKAELYIKRARGNFDPVLSSNFNEKQFSDDPYYSIFSSKLSVPTYFGLSAEGGYDFNQGVYLNPENNVPPEGLYNLGLKLTLGKGLFIDKRRAELQKAKIYSNSTLLERRIMLNDLVREAASVYWSWFTAYYLQEIALDARDNALQRFNAVRTEAAAGNSPSIDTLEAKLQLQNRQLNLQQAQLNYKNVSQLLNVYLWQDGFIPLELDTSIRPKALSELSYMETSWLGNKDSLINAHPKLLKLENTVSMSTIDLRLKKENLKPQLDLKYNLLSANSDQFWANAPANYKAGVQFNFPIFLREERAEVKLNKLEIEQLRSEQSLQRQFIEYKVQKSINDMDTYRDQWQLSNDQYQGYEQLLQAENKLFSAGESSLFLVNRRELSYIDAREKLIKSVSSYYMSVVDLKTTLFIADQP